MFLTELKEKLEGLQAERGNVPLSKVHVMHGNAELIAHNASIDEVPGRRPVTIAEAEGLTGTIEERLQRAGEQAGGLGIVSVTAEELAQLLEYRDELRALYQTKVNEPVAEHVADTLQE